MFVLEKQDTMFVFSSGKRRLRIHFYSSSIVRVTYIEGRDFTKHTSHIACAKPEPVAVQIEEEPVLFRLTGAYLVIEVDKQSGALSYYQTDGKLLMKEPERGGKWLTPKEVRKNIFAQESEIASAQSVDGARATSTEYRTVMDRMAYEARLDFMFSPEEALFGLGSHEEGYGNLRGRSRDLYQQNMKAVVPFLVSTRGYGVLLDCESAMTFHDDACGSWLWADCVEELDFYFIAGSDFREVHRRYHWLTGTAPMLPKWALGYVQSKERYVHAEEMLDVVREYRRCNIPLDAIVLDWKSWPNGEGWGQKEFDPIRFPDPEEFIEKLHAMGVHLMVSIWPIMTGGCADQREMLANDLMLGNQSTYNAFSKDARKYYWEQARRGLYAKGVDAWWCDCTEPFEADWNGAVKPEPHMRFAVNTEAAKLYLDPGKANSYSLVHSQGIYEGQRSLTSEKRVVNLTRSSYAGQHRYGTITWSGDICGTWEALRRSIPEGVNFCAAGEPYWTVDIGGFFVGYDPNLWFWRGDYRDGCRGLTAMDALEPDPDDTGCRDLGYHELYTRWLQYATFLPMFRSHGTDAAREIWRFGESGSPFYDAIAYYIRLRYRLIPYMYSLMAQVTHDGSPMMRAVALEYPDDAKTHDLTDQFMLGSALMVCPVIKPMYYKVNSEPLTRVQRKREVYLPAGRIWFDYWTGKEYRGGQWIFADAPLEVIPLFVPSGSILLMTEAMQYVDERTNSPYEILIYTGRNAQFVIYEDMGDGYDYEQGAFTLVKLRWDQNMQELVIAAREGSFPGMVETREYRLVFVARGRREVHTVLYTGKEIRVQWSNEPKEFA